MIYLFLTLLIKKKRKIINSDIKIEKIKYDLPNTMDFHQWGEVIFLTKTRSIVRRDSKSIYFINIFKNKLIVQLKNEKKVLISFEDIKKEEDNLSTFIRTVNDLVHFEDYFYINGEIKLRTNQKKTPFISQKEKEINITDKFLTMDIETRNINGELSPYCISIFDGKISNSFYLSEYNNSEEMIKDSIKSIMRKNIMDIKYISIIYHILMEYF